MLWWSGWHQVTVLLLGGAWQNPRLGVVSMFISGAGVDVVVSTLVVLCPVSPTAQTGSHSCVCQTGNYHQGCCPILCNFVQHSSNYTKFSIVGRVLDKVAQDWATALVIVPGLANTAVAPSLCSWWNRAQHHQCWYHHVNTCSRNEHTYNTQSGILSGTSQQQDCHLMSPRSPQHHHGGSAYSQHTFIQHPIPSATMAELLYMNEWMNEMNEIIYFSA